MAGRSLLFGAASNGGSNINSTVALLQNQMLHASSPCSSEQPLGSLFMAGPSFLGSRSMVSFKDVNGANRSEKSFFRSFDQDENEDEDFEYCHQPEKKRRLTVEQVQFLERSFEADNKLEPERKVQLARDLGLQPRQIAIWFQNRRARWKTKNLEKEYDALKASFDTLKADYDNLLKEKEKLQAEVLNLTDKLLLKDNEKNSTSCDSDKLFEAPPPKAPDADSVSANERSKVPASDLKQDDLSSAKSDVFDSDSPHCADGVHSSFLEPGDSSYVFEPDLSDTSQDEDDNLSKNLFPPAYVFPKTEDADYPGPPAISGFSFPLEDHAFNFWSC